MSTGSIDNNRPLNTHNEKVEAFQEAQRSEGAAEQAALSYAQHNTFEQIQANAEADGFTIADPSLPPPVSAGGIPQHHLATQQESAQGQAVALQLFAAGESIDNPATKQRLDAVAAQVQTLGNLPPDVRDDILASAGDLAAKVRSGELSQGDLEALLSELESKLGESGQKYAEGAIEGQKADALQAHKERLEKAEEKAEWTPAQKFFGFIALIFAAPILSLVESVGRLDGVVKGNAPSVTPLTDLAEKLGLIKPSGPENPAQPEGLELAANGLSHIEMLKLLQSENPESEERKKELQEAILALQSGNPVPAEEFLGLKPAGGVKGEGGEVDPSLVVDPKPTLVVDPPEIFTALQTVPSEVADAQAAAKETEAEVQRRNSV